MKTPLLILLLVSLLFSLNVTFRAKPATYQFYPRTEANTGLVKIQGAVRDTGIDTLSVTLTRNNRPCGRTAVLAVYQADSLPFDFQLPIPAELAEYGVRFYADTALALAADSLVAGDAFVINGQSNAITFALGPVHEFIRTWAADLNGFKISEQGHEYGDQCDVGYWGQHLAFQINQNQGIPVFIVNGGQPSMPITYFVPNASGYTDVRNRVTKAGLKDHIKAGFFYQGEANSTAGIGPAYLASFQSIYQGWKTDFPAMKKLYACQIGAWSQLNGINDTDVCWARNTREIQRRYPETCPDVRVMATLGSPQPGGHWGGEGYLSIADKLYRLVAHDLYGSGDTAGIHAPNILRAWYVNAGRDRIVLQFDQPVFWKDSLNHKLADYFALDDVYRVVDTGWHEPEFNRIVLKLKGPSTATKITYLTGGFYLMGDRAGITSGAPVYKGPYLYNARRVGALTFHEFPVGEPGLTDTAAVASLELTAPKSSLLRFESAQLRAVTAYSGGLTDTNPGVAFRSLDTFVVRVNPDGLVRGFNPGTGRVIATRGGKSDTVTFTVGSGFSALEGLAFTATVKSLRTMLQGDSLPLRLAALKIENGDTLRFAMDTLAQVLGPSPQLRIVSNFIYGVQAGDSLLLTAEAAGLRCSTRVTVVPAPTFIRRINFQASNAALSAIPGWIMESGTAYSAVRGCGFVNATGLGGYLLNSSDRNYFRNTMIIMPRDKIERTYRVDAPAGRYRLRIRNFNYNFCRDTSYVRHGTDTLLYNRLCNYSWDYDMQITRDITITGDSGLVLGVYGGLCYLILASDDGTDFDLVAKDETGPVYPPLVTMASEEGAVGKDQRLCETPLACPNPFNPATTIRFGLPSGVSAEYGIFNVRGQCLKRFHLGAASGVRSHALLFGESGAGRAASGLYYGRLVRSDGKVFSNRLLLVR